MRRIVMLTAGLALSASVGCAGHTGVLELDLNGKRVEVHNATTVGVPKGNESLLELREWTMRIAGQEPITVTAGGKEHTLYTTDTTIQIDGRAVDLMQGEKIIITEDGVTLPTMQPPATKPEGDGGGDGKSGEAGQ